MGVRAVESGWAGFIRAGRFAQSTTRAVFRELGTRWTPLAELTSCLGQWCDAREANWAGGSVGGSCRAERRVVSNLHTLGIIHCWAHLRKNDARVWTEEALRTLRRRVRCSESAKIAWIAPRTGPFASIASYIGKIISCRNGNRRNIHSLADESCWTRHLIRQSSLETSRIMIIVGFAAYWERHMVVGAFETDGTRLVLSIGTKVAARAVSQSSWEQSIRSRFRSLSGNNIFA
jgi:hypothetical protein